MVITKTLRDALALFFLCAPWPMAIADELPSFSEAPHGYWERQPTDRFARLMARWKENQSTLDPSSEKAMLTSLLQGLEIADSTQVLVFSATSLQSGIVNPRNPRAIYFNEDTFVGFIPGGRFEIASFDPEAGMVFYISERSFRGATPAFVRSNRCMNCHADAQSKNLPGLVLNSVGVTRDGSTQETYRYDEIGHQVPLDVRFGGWHLTGGHRLGKNHANLVGNLTPSGFAGQANPPGKNCDLGRYPRPTSDILTNLVLEHQAGFLNRVIEAIYFARARPEDTAGLDSIVDDLVRYVLFAEEAKLPADGIEGDSDFIRDFQARGKGSGLRQFNLRSRMFETRCSYLIESEIWQALPASAKKRAEERLREAVAPGSTALAGAHLGPEEKARIRALVEAR